MATLTVTLPAVIKLTNNTDNAIPFQPYHENFSAYVPAHKSLEFEVGTAGQYFYYEKQAKDVGLEFAQLVALDTASDSIIVIDLPSLVTITNVTEHGVNFKPYRESFTVAIAKNDAVVLEATTVGQVLAYLAQEQVNDGIAVTFAAKA